MNRIKRAIISVMIVSVTCMHVSHTMLASTDSFHKSPQAVINLDNSATINQVVEEHSKDWVHRMTSPEKYIEPGPVNFYCLR